MKGILKEDKQMPPILSGVKRSPTGWWEGEVGTRKPRFSYIMWHQGSSEKWSSIILSFSKSNCKERSAPPPPLRGHHCISAELGWCSNLLWVKNPCLRLVKCRKWLALYWGKDRVINWQEEGERSHQRAAAMPKCLIGDNLSPGRHVPGRRWAGATRLVV